LCDRQVTFAELAQLPVERLGRERARRLDQHERHAAVTAEPVLGRAGLPRRGRLRRRLAFRRGLARASRQANAVQRVPRREHVEAHRGGRGVTEVRRLGYLRDHALHRHVEDAAQRDRPPEHVVGAEKPLRRVLRENGAVWIAQRVLRVARDERQVEDL